MRIAAAQLVSGTDPEANLELVRDAVRRAAGHGARLVLLPEATMCAFGVPLGPVAQPLDGPWATAVRQIAEDLPGRYAEDWLARPDIAALLAD